MRRLGILARRRVPVDEPQETPRGLDGADAAQAWNAASHVGRLRAVPWALATFILGFTLDDLRMLRVPAALTATVAATVLLAAGPALFARGPFQRARHMTPADAMLYLDRMKTRTGLLVAGSILATVGWLVLLGNHLTPRW